MDISHDSDEIGSKSLIENINAHGFFVKNDEILRCLTSGLCIKTFVEHDERGRFTVLKPCMFW